MDDSEQASSPEPSSRLVALSWGLGRQRYVVLWSDSAGELFGSSMVIGSFSSEMMGGLLLLWKVVSSGSIMGAPLFLLLSCFGRRLWTVYCRIRLSSPPMTVTVLGNGGHFLDGNLSSLSDRSIGAVKHGLVLTEVVLYECH
jgi:hypothetical protein